jgi:hypothetical protein
MILGLISLKSLLSLILLGGIFYYGWPVIEAIMISLPIPDPKDVTEKLKGVFKRQGKSAKRGDDSGTKKPQGKAAGYQEGFNQAPESLEEEEDDDDDDVGKPINLNNHPINYDSDEEKHNNELINLDGPSTTSRDRIATAAEQIPKLQKPL